MAKQKLTTARLTTLIANCREHGECAVSDNGYVWSREYRSTEWDPRTFDAAVRGLVQYGFAIAKNTHARSIQATIGTTESGRVYVDAMQINKLMGRFSPSVSIIVDGLTEAGRAAMVAR